MKRFGWIIGLLAVASLGFAVPAIAQTVSAKTVSACGTPGNTPVVGLAYPITQDATGTLCTNATVTGGGTTVKATAAAPTFVEGSTTNQLSSDLSGGLRISGTISASSTVKATAADPTYVEGSTSNPVSVDLSGYARSLAKQSGSWNIVNISGTISLPTGASTSANQTSQITQETAINTNLTNITGTKAAGTAAANSALTGCVYNSTPLTLTNGQQAASGCTVKGNIISVLGDPTTGAPLDPTAASAVQCGTTTGTMVQCAISSNQVLPDTAGASRYPQAGTANRTLTGTSLSSNTNTTICPTATNPVSTEIYFVVAGVGVGLNGQTLTGAAPTATTTNSPDFVSTAGMLYVAPLGISNAITAYGAAGVVRCVQTLRQ